MGRPKGSTAQRIWADALRKTALERVKEHGNARKLDLAAKAAWAKAMAGDAAVLKELGDRIDGKVPQDGSIDANITVEIVRFGKG